MLICTVFVLAAANLILQYAEIESAVSKIIDTVCKKEYSISKG